MKKIGFMGLILSQLLGCAATGPITVEEIGQLSDARIRYSSVGCFHDQQYEITIRENVLHIKEANLFGSKHGTAQATYLGHVMLDEKKIADLNLMFEHLSTTIGHCSTTRLDVELSYTSFFGQRISQRISNDFCAGMPNDGSYTLDAAIDDVETKRKRL